MPELEQVLPPANEKQTEAPTAVVLRVKPESEMPVPEPAPLPPDETIGEGTEP